MFLLLAGTLGLQTTRNPELLLQLETYEDLSADEIKDLMAELGQELENKEEDSGQTAESYLQVTAEMSDTTGSDETSSDSSDTSSTSSSDTSSTDTKSTDSQSSDSSSSDDSSDSSSSTSEATSDDDSSSTSEETSDDDDSIEVILTSDEDGNATVDVNNSQEDYANGKNATYNYTVSIYEDDDDLEITVDDYSTSETSQNITTMLKKASDYMNKSEVELSDAYEAYYEAKENLKKELGEFKEAIVYAEDVYIKIINYDSDSDEYKTNEVTFRSDTTPKEKYQEVKAEVEETEAEETEDAEETEETTESSSDSSSTTTKVEKDLDDEEKNTSYSVSAYKKGVSSSDDDETSSKYYIIDGGTTVEVAAFLQKTPRFFSSFLEEDSLFQEKETAFVLASSSLDGDRSGVVWLINEAGHKRVLLSNLTEPKALCYDRTNSKLYVIASAYGTEVVYQYKTFTSPEGKFVVKPEASVVYEHPHLLDVAVDENGDLYVLTSESLVRLSYFQLSSSIFSVIQRLTSVFSQSHEVVDASTIYIEDTDTLFYVRADKLSLVKLTHEGPVEYFMFNEAVTALAICQDRVYIATASEVQAIDKTTGAWSKFADVPSSQHLACGDSELYIQDQDAIISANMRSLEVKRVAVVPGVTSVAFVNSI